MATIVTRETTQTDGTSPKGSPLTNAEVDTNFINLNDDKVEVSGAIIFEAQAGEALAKGDVVYVSGVSGNTPVVSKADADDANKMPAYGLAEDAANLNAAVSVVTFGTLYELDTSSFSAGDTVYVSATAGSLTTTKPSGESSLIQNVGTVIRSHASAGSIKVGGAGRTNDTPNLDDGNVFIGNASNQAEARALTGDDISGGTITSFGSTGIDDNASQTSMVLSNGSMRILSDDLSNHIASIFGYDDTNTTQLGKLQFGAATGQNSGIYSATAFSISNAAGDSTYTFTVDTANNEVEINGALGVGGIANPQAPLHVYKTEASVGETDPIARFERFTTGDNAYLDITVDNDNNLIGFQSTGTSDGGFTFGGAATERMRLTSAGKLGILTNNPARELDIKLVDTTATTLGQKGGINLYAPSNTVGNGGEITWSSAVNGEVWAAISGHIVSNGSGTAGGELVFATAVNSALPIERMRLDTAGNFGIGVTDPTATLDVNGTIKLDADYPNGTANTALGNLALDAVTSGSSNTAIGRSALTELTSGAANTAVGALSLDAVTTGSSNTAVGYAALSTHTTGTFNSAIARETLFYNTTGVHNSGSGYAALYNNTTGNYNTAFGSQALVSTTTVSGSTGVGYRAGYTADGSIVTAIGYQALFSNTTGANNTAVGYNAMLSNTTGASNTAVGNIALDANTTGSNNVAMGYSALGQNTTGSENVAIGRSCLTQNTTGTVTTAVGYTALYSNTTGHSSTAMGYEALLNNTTGTHNAAFGRESLEDNTTGYYNAAFGTFSLYDNTTGQSNVGVGYGAVQSNTTANYNTGVGYQALLTNTTSSNNVAVGSFAAKSNTGGSNTAIGYATLWASGAGSNNTAVGLNALFSNTSANWNTAVGTSSLVDSTTGNYLTAVGGYALENNTTGARNTGVGYASLRTNTTGGYNTGLGYAALNANAAGFYNTAVGYGAALSLTNDNYNVAIGYEALRDFTVVGTSGNVAVGALSQAGASSYYNVSVGYQSLKNATQQANTAVGHRALLTASAATYNTAVGYAALDAATTGSYSTAIGSDALGAVTTGSYNTAVGRNAHGGLSTGSNNTAVGNDSGYGITSGTVNTHVGVEAGYAVTTGSHNTAVGYQAGRNAGAGNYGSFLGNYAGRLTTGNSNVGVGYAALYLNQSGANNAAVGVSALYNSLTNQNAALGSSALQNQTSGNNNTAVGYAAGFSLTTGASNTFVGGYNSSTGGAGYYMTTGGQNTILGAFNGNQNNLDIRTANKNVVVSDGDGNIHFRSHYGADLTTYTQAKHPFGIAYGNGGVVHPNAWISYAQDNDNTTAFRWAVKYDLSIWATAHILVTASAVDSVATDRCCAWWLYETAFYNSAFLSMSLKDYGGDTSSFSLSFSDQGTSNNSSAFIFDLSISSISGNNSIIANAKMSSYQGVYEAWRMSS